MREHTTMWWVGALLLLAGCAEKPPSCRDDGVQHTLLQLIEEHDANGLEKDQGVPVKVDRVMAMGYDESSGVWQCSATIVAEPTDEQLDQVREAQQAIERNSTLLRFLGNGASELDFHPLVIAIKARDGRPCPRRSCTGRSPIRCDSTPNSATSSSSLRRASTVTKHGRCTSSWPACHCRRSSPQTIPQNPRRRRRRRMRRQRRQRHNTIQHRPPRQKPHPQKTRRRSPGLDSARGPVPSQPEA